MKKYIPYLLESPELMHAAGITASPERMQVTLEDRRAETEEPLKPVVFEAPYPDAADQIARSHYLLTRQVYANSQPDWAPLAVTEPESTPPYLDFPENHMQMREIPGLDAMYMQFWTNSNVGSTKIGDFCEEALEAYRKNPTRHVIVDQRFNGGGNLSLIKDCMRAFGQSVPSSGHAYIIIGGATFSAGIYSAAFLKQGAGAKAVLVGEPVGDALRNWAEDNLLRLPNSEIEIKFSTGMHDLAQPCRDWKKCHWGVMFVDLAIENLDPDIPAPLTFKDFMNGIDPAMEAIRAHMAGTN
ncbi:MAG: hypothetical protein HKO64_03825 [Xanthomonadales bacterium]|nr:hypothetical protein [Xanthomonadales bacterium]